MARLGAGAFVVLLFAAVALLRAGEGFSNVDDYLYAAQTQAYLDALPDPGALVDAVRAYGSNSPLVPLLALPLAAVDASPNVLVSVQLVPLLILLGSARVLLGALGLRAPAAWAGAAGVTASAPVISYAAMYHFGVTAAACSALALAAYARSERLTRRWPAVLAGVALGLLALTRVVAPVYVFAVALPIAVDVLAGIRREQAVNAGLAVLAAVVVALPWWAVAGGRAWDYLVDAGYGETVFTREASRAEIARERLDWTMDETGWLLALVLVALVAYAAVCVWRRVEGWRLLACLLAAIALGMAALATSSNAGTAFALPLVVLAACAGVASLRHARPKVRSAAVVVWTLALVIGVLGVLRVVPEASVADQPLWREGIPGWEQARTALACERCDVPDSDRLNREVLRRIGREPTLILRADALLNPNGLRDVGNAMLSAATQPGTVTARDLAASRHVITGATPAPYLPPPNPLEARAALMLAGFERVLERRISSRNTVEVWSRAAR